MPIKLNTASGGGVILQGANTASDKTITIPADDGTMIYANSSGNVGIGSSTPPSYGAGGKTLLIAGSQFPNVGLSATASSTGNKNYRWIARDDANGGPIMQFQTTDDSWGSEQNIWFVSRSTTGISYQSWYTGAAGSNAERMRLDSTGKLTVNADASFTGEKLTSAGTGLYVASFGNTSNVSGQNVLALGLLSNGNNTSTHFLRGNTSGVGNWYLYGNGTTSFSSDQRLKKNIEETRDGYAADLCRLRVVKYHWKNQDDDAPRELGLIAQEVEQVFPGLVQEDTQTVGGGDETIYKQLKVSVLPFMLLKAIQEQQAMIEELKAKVAALEAK